MRPNYEGKIMIKTKEDLEKWLAYNYAGVYRQYIDYGKQQTMVNIISGKNK